MTEATPAPVDTRVRADWHLMPKCPRKRCGAEPGEQCRDMTGALTWVHLNRLRAAGLAKPKKRRRRGQKSRAKT